MMRLIIALCIALILVVSAFSFVLPKTDFTISAVAATNYSLDNFASPTTILDVPYNLSLIADYNICIKDFTVEMKAIASTPDYFKTYGLTFAGYLGYNKAWNGLGIGVLVGAKAEKYPISAPFELSFPVEVSVSYSF